MYVQKSLLMKLLSLSD